MPEPLVLRTFDDAITRITLNRPQKRNALTRELLHELRGALECAIDSSGMRLLVLSGAGPAFCAGMDLGQMQETAALPGAAELWRADTALYGDVIRLLLACPCPTLAVAQGPAIAGGMGLLLACDLAIASQSATFALPEPKRGITAAVVTPLLVQRVGVSTAAYLLLSGRAIDAERALQVGLCHQLFPPAALDEQARSLEQSILTGAPEALALTKQLLRQCASANVLSQLAQAEAVSAHARETAAAREGLQAFLEKREPAWSRALAGESGERKAESRGTTNPGAL